MLRLKNGVNAAGMKPESLLIVMIAKDVCREMGKECVITSITDGKHSANSLHYEGLAVDLRTRHMIDSEQKEFKDQMAARLGGNYDVVLERTHVHVEFDPK